MIKYYGPFTIKVDSENQVTRVELKRRGPENWQLLSTEIEKLRQHVLRVAADYGFPVVEA